MAGDPDPRGSVRAICEHQWQPVSMVFEHQLLSDRGQVIVRVPDSEAARVYLVCLRCATHTYMTTAFLYRLYGSEDQAKDGSWIYEDAEPAEGSE